MAELRMATADEGRIPSALYADLFYNNPGATEFRGEYLSVWLRVHLSKAGSGSLATLRDRFEQAHPGSTVDVTVLGVVCEQLQLEGLLKHVDAQWELTTAGRTEVIVAEKRYHSSRSAFFAKLRSSMAVDYGVELVTEESTVFDECLETVIVRCLLEERETLGRLFSDPEDFSRLPASANRRAEELELCFASKLPESQRTRRIEIRRAAVRALTHRYDEGRTYLHSIQRAVIGSFFLVQDPHHTEKLRTLLHSRVYYLDSNVYFAWLYRSQHGHGVVKPLLDSLRKHGVELRMFERTIDEIEQVERDALVQSQRAERDPSLARYLRSNRKAIAADFLAAKEQDRNISLSPWSRVYTGVRRILPNLGVAVSAEATPPGFEADLDTFRNAVRGTKKDAKRFPREEAIDHDAEVLLAVASLQLADKKRNAWGSGVRFVTLDHTVNDALRELRNALNRRYELADHPSRLASFILPLSSRELDRDQYESFVVASIQDYLGVTTEMTGYGPVKLIQAMEAAGVPVRTLLEAPAELVEPALADLQGRTGLRGKIDQAVAIEDASAKLEALAQISRDVAEAVAFGGELLADAERQLAMEREGLEGLTLRLRQTESLSSERKSEIERMRAMLTQALSAQEHALREIEDRRQELETTRVRLHRTKVVGALLGAGAIVLVLLLLL